MTSPAPAPTPCLADILSSDTVDPITFTRTLNDYMESGSSIGDGAMIAKALDRNSASFAPQQLADILKCCVAGTVNQLQKRFPAEARQWARIAYETTRLASLYSEAKENVQAHTSYDDLESTINLAGREAISFHRHDSGSTEQALETGHLLTMATRSLYPNHNVLDTSSGNM